MGWRLWWWIRWLRGWTMARLWWRIRRRLGRRWRWRLGRLWWWQDGRWWPRTGQGRSTGTLLNQPSPPSHNIHTSHKKTRLSLLTKPRCYEKKIETYSNYLNLFTLNLLCTPAECLYTTFTHFGPEVKNCQPIF